MKKFVLIFFMAFVLVGNAMPTCFADEYYLGQFVALMEMQVFFSCAIALIDPFNQPGVELGKKVSKEILAGTEKSGKIFELKNFMRRGERYTL